MSPRVYLHGLLFRVFVGVMSRCVGESVWEVCLCLSFKIKTHVVCSAFCSLALRQVMNMSVEERPQWMRILAFLYKHLGEDDVCSALRRRFAVCPETRVRVIQLQHRRPFALLFLLVHLNYRRLLILWFPLFSQLVC